MGLTSLMTREFPSMTEFSFPASLYDLEHGFAMGFSDGIPQSMMQLLLYVPLIDIESWSSAHGEY